MATQYSFLPWARQGVISGVQTPDKDGLDGYAKLPIQLELNTISVGAEDVQDPPINVNLHLYGPADIIGIDRRQIIRTEPEPHTQNFLPNYLAAIEFDRPDFPWLFTPAKAKTENGRLRPWICLIVVKQQDGVSLSSRSGSPLPVLKIQSLELARQELPDLSESWAWVHSQVLHEEGLSNLENALNRQPNLTLSRLLCPRRLEANTRYYACLVPTFEVGRKAGLNIPLEGDEKDIEKQVLYPAWDFPGSGDSPESIELPVYYHWEFGTGQGGDFEDLAQKLKPKAYKNIGSRQLYVGQAGVPDWEDMGSVDLEGVFRSVKDNPPPDSGEQPWVQPLKSVLHTPDASSTSTDPTVGPPIYAHFHQSLQQLSDKSPLWLNDLNLDVRNRVAAGLGVFLVQKLQEELMHSAWQQLGDIQQAQQLKRQQELGQEVNQSLYKKHFKSLDKNGKLDKNRTLLYQMTAPAHSRVLTQSGVQTIRSWSVKQQLPTMGTISTFRKLSRPGGPIARRMQTQPSLSQPIDVKPQGKRI